MDFRGLNESGVASQLKTLGLTDQRQLFRRLPQDLLFPSFDLPKEQANKSSRVIFDDYFKE